MATAANALRRCAIHRAFVSHGHGVPSAVISPVLRLHFPTGVSAAATSSTRTAFALREQKRCASTAPTLSGDPSLEPNNTYIGMGQFEAVGEDAGRMARGTEYMEDALAVQEKEYLAVKDLLKKAIKGLGIAQARLQVARQHHQQNDYAEAISHYDRARAVAEEALESCEMHDAEEEGRGAAAASKGARYARFMLSEIFSGLGVAQIDSGDAKDEAVSNLQHALELRKDTVGKRHVGVAECLNNLANVYFGRGSLQKALEHYEQALELLTEAAGGPQGAYVALTVYNIALCRKGLGQPEAAIVSLKKALKIATEALGPTHRQVELIETTLQQVAEQVVAERAPPASAP